MITIMNRDQSMNIAAMLAEDVGAPELRNPMNSGMSSWSLLDKVMKWIVRGFSK